MADEKSTSEATSDYPTFNPMLLVDLARHLKERRVTNTANAHFQMRGMAQDNRRDPLVQEFLRLLVESYDRTTNSMNISAAFIACHGKGMLKAFPRFYRVLLALIQSCEEDGKIIHWNRFLDGVAPAYFLEVAGPADTYDYDKAVGDFIQRYYFLFSRGSAHSTALRIAKECLEDEWTEIIYGPRTFVWRIVYWLSKRRRLLKLLLSLYAVDPSGPKSLTEVVNADQKLFGPRLILGVSVAEAEGPDALCKFLCTEIERH